MRVNQAKMDIPNYNPAFDKADKTGTLHHLLRGELAAIECYDQVLEKFPTSAAVQELRRMRVEHYAASRYWRERVRLQGGDENISSGPWGAFAGVVTGMAKTIGLPTVISALKEGEEHGVSNYVDALTNTEVPADCRATIENKLLPMCRQHVVALTQLTADAN